MSKEILAARDWKGFFQALIQFALTVLPLITPLLTEEEKSTAIEHLTAKAVQE